MKTNYTVVLTGSLTQQYTTMFSCSAAGSLKCKCFLADIVLNWYTNHLRGMTAEVAQLIEILEEVRHRLRVHIAYCQLPNWSLLHRHKNVLFAHLFKPFGTCTLCT